MPIFICWSGTRTRHLARAVYDLLESQESLKGSVFFSDTIEKGVTWFESIIDNLRDADAGVVCLTAENLESPWLHFEAGALALAIARPNGTDAETAKRPRTRLFTLLHGATTAELKGPLSAFQATNATPNDMKPLVAILENIVQENDRRKNRSEEPHDAAEQSAQSNEAPARTGTAAEAHKADPWKTYQDALDKIAVPVRELIPDFESLFQRKTFNEPLHHCADQAWLNRHNGVRITHERLDRQRPRVNAACTRSDAALFEMLLAELDGYGMALEALLLESKKFRLGEHGELEMDQGIRTCCEDRRLAIRSLYGRLLNSLDSPLRPEAVRFMGAETNEERKMIVHRLEGNIRLAWETVAAKGTQSLSNDWKKAVADLTCSGKSTDSPERCAAETVHDSPEATRSNEPIAFRASSWDLDRIYYYLLVQYFRTTALPSGAGTDGSKVATDDEFVCLARDVEMEVERFRAKSKGGSLTPLTYALVALQTLDPDRTPEGSDARRAAENTLDLVENDLRIEPDGSRAESVGPSTASGRTLSVRMREALAAVIRINNLDRPVPRR